MNTSIRECDCCHYTTATQSYTVTLRPDLAPDVYHYCDVCAASGLSVIVKYRNPNEELARALGYCTNLILAQIAEARQS